MSQPTHIRRCMLLAAVLSLAVSAPALAAFPKVNTFTVDAVLGGWAQAQKDHFNDGASYDQVIAAAKR